MSFENFPTLQQCLWQRPADYAGAQWDGEAVVFETCRDANLMTQSNWDALCRIGKDSEHVHIARASHWAFGWVEHLLLKPTAPDALKQEFEDALNALSDYPVLDDEDLSRREWVAAIEYWGDSPRERAPHINHYNVGKQDGQKVPLMAARHSFAKLREQYDDFGQWLYNCARE